MSDSNKLDANWILCPSKSTPGKFYYFNVTTGEALWTNDTDGNTRKNDKNIYKVIDNSHVNPEPVFLPEEIQRKNITKTIYSYTNNQQNLNKPCPSFGQVMFPQYFPHSPSLMPGVMWTPIPMPFTICKEEKPILDQYTQTSELRDTMIQTCNISLSERFTMLGCNTDLESYKKKIVIPSTLHSVNLCHKTTLISNDDDNYMKQQCTRKIRSPILKEPNLKLPLKINKPKDNISNNNIETVNSSQSKQYIKERMDKEKDVFQNLDKTDLRHLLILKKQKSIDSSVFGGHKKEKGHKTVQKIPIKKKITFNLDTMAVKDGDNKIKPPMPIHLLRNLLETQNLIDHWYIITDRDVLLDDINFITDYINGDDICKLLVLKSVLKVVESSGRGDGGRPEVLAARQTYRHVVNYKKVEIVDMGKNMTFNDQIINCCLQEINEEKHIVLITKNTTLLKRAKSFEIHAYYLDDIKNCNSEERLHSKSSQSEENIYTFLQTEEDYYDPFVFNKSSNIYDNTDNQTKIFNDCGSNDKNNDETFSIKQDGKEDLKICRVISNFNCSKQKNSKEKLHTTSSKPDENIHKKKYTFLQTEEDYYDPFVFNKSSNIYDNTDNQIKIFNDCRSNDKNNDKTFSIKQNGKEDLKICRVISNFNCSKQKNVCNNSGEVSKIINSTYTNRKTDNTTNNYQKSFKPLVFQKIFSSSDNVFDKTDAAQEDKRDCGRGDNNYHRNESKTRQNFNQSTDNTIHKHKDKTENKMSFHIKDKNMENNIVIRINEYSCCYVQVMEEFINIVLEKNSFVKHFVPYFFHEGLECLKEFCLNVNVKHVIDKLLLHWKKKDNIKKAKPNDFMRLLEYGWLLIDLLKDSIPDAFKEIFYLYRKLLENIENPVVEDIELMQRSPRECQDNINRCNFVKDKFEIVNYLKKHFSEWKDFEMPEEEGDLKNSYDDKIQIIRTSGKHLKSFKIDKKKRITFCTNSENESRLNKNNSKSNKTEATLIRNTKVMEEYEETIKKSDLFLDFNEAIESSLTIVTNNEVSDSLTNDVNLVNDNDINDISINDVKLVNDNEINDGHNDTTDSGCETEMHTSSFLQDFFVHLSCTLKDIFSFVNKCNNNLRDETIKEKDRNCMYERATQICDHLNHIIDKLSSIIERETKENSKLKALLIKTGQDMSEDKRITRYRQTVIKCLEQAQILKSCLKLLLNTNKQNVTDDVSMDSYNVTYFNIFE